MNRRDELDAMYVILCKGCAGMNCMDCPGREYDHCGDYNKAVKLYDAGWHKREKGTWETFPSLGKDYRCSNCLSARVNYKYKYCPLCGAEMENAQ